MASKCICSVKPTAETQKVQKKYTDYVQSAARKCYPLITI